MSKKDDRETIDILTIDLNELDTEWVNQPGLYYKAARDFADTKADLEEEKNNLNLIHAEIGNDVREDPTAYAIVKPTEKAIEAAILTSDSYQKALKILNTKKHAVDIASAWVTALDHRKRALENTVKLHGQEYFSKPQAAQEDAEEMTKRAARTKTKRRKRD